ncbi:GGDEF domain-containing protein [Marivibrio halodurans]|uniref:diguanylate cyclase n=1 Tax=Marivibrio halodurans TaxID=2039722 RepID=A0A8J7S746_9PROT|nr:GGDEF domain-containing protein [Marivibrio halodurans]MBP5858039.1 GGDEF domain-containing protein [Marivibrio halodurans]
MYDMDRLLSIERVSRTALWKIYLSALSILFMTIVASHFLTETIVAKMDRDARVLHQVETQRTLIERVSGRVEVAALRRQADTGSLNVVRRDIDRLEALHLEVTAGPDRLVLSEDTESNARICARAFIAESRALIAGIEAGEPIGPARLADYVTATQTDLLGALDHVAQAYRDDADNLLIMLRYLDLGLLGVALLVLLGEVLLIFRPLTRRLDKAQTDLANLAQTDPLTGSWNRRALMRGGDMLWALTERQGQPFCAVIGDIDHFKRVNDTHGHAIGDQVIRHFAESCLGSIRGHDILGRYGGEEFVILLPNTTIEAAARIAERVRETFASTPLTIPTGEGTATIESTVSFGVAQRMAGDESLHSLIERADGALYVAKETGRNRVQRAQTSPETPPSN